MKKFILMLLTLVFVCALFGVQENKTYAEDGLEVIKTHTGSDLTYRGTNEKVYRLSEYNYPTNQLRAAWVTVFAGDILGYTSETQFKEMMNNVLDDMDRMGMNAIVFHVRTHNNALYKSELNPLASWWSNVNFDEFDPLEWLIEECHSRGIEFHAWLNPYRVSGNGTNSQYAVEPLPAVNPANDESNLLKVGSNVIFDPGIPEVRDFIVDTCMELIENYDVDAIHFDDYFYISGANDAETREKYNTENLSIGDFRRKQVDLFIEALSNEIRAYNAENNKTVQLGISPSGIYKNGSYQATPTYDSNGNLISPTYSNTSGFAHYDDYLYSDTLNWINHEWIDYIMPQCYWAIEHSIASFVELTKWWSWTVRYKKVNFYTGLGIYMAADSSTSGSYAYWKYNENEIQLQLLNAGQYVEFDGACFYKYSSLKATSSNVVNHAVNLISNDYWAKKIPGAISKYYAPLVDEVAPTGLSYDEVTSTLRFNAVENTRGYMVYKVPKGQTLDKKNIDHVYDYIQDTSIVVDDFYTYDYYVASVNLANETSDAVTIKSVEDASTIINMINNLPNPITYENKDTINQIRNLYNNLPITEQQKVTNLDILIQAESLLKQYEVVAQNLQDYIDTLDLHIKINRTIPLQNNMTLEYKNSEDQNLYNLTTGTRLKNYLATKEIPLIITLTEGELTVSQEILVNIGYTAKDQNGLFYRNDPSSMSPDDEGAYEEGGSGYIGWSGHTFVVENNILYIADGNYHEITDASTIAACNWASVAGVYVNKSAGNVAFKLTDAFDSKSSTNDGYIVVAQDEIKTLGNGFDTEVTITLAPNEAIIIVRYLDSIITGAPMAPVTKLSVGMKAYVDEEAPLTPQDEADFIMQLIETIPTDISLADEDMLLNIQNQYNNLTDEAKALVNNYQKLLEALDRLNQLKEALESQKQQAINEVNSYLDLNNYSNATKELINDYLTSVIDAINKVENETEIQTIVDAAKSKLDDYLTIEEENAILLQEAKDEYKQKIDELILSFTDIIEDEKAELIINGDKFKAQIDNATSISDVKYIWTRAEDTLNLYFENAEKARLEAIAEINNYVNQLTYPAKEIAKIKDLAASEADKIRTMASIAEINQVPSDFRKMVENLHEALVTLKDEVNLSLDDLVKSWYTDAEKVHIEALIALAKAEILEAGDTQEVEAIKNQCIEDVEAYIEGLSKAIGDAEAYLNSLDATLTSVKQLIYQYKQQISSASTVEEVASLLVTFEKAYFEALVDAIKTELNAYIENLDYNAKEKTHIKTQQDALYTQIATLDNIEEVEALVEAFKVATQNAHTELIQKRDEAINKVETASKKTDEALTYCTQILSDLNLAGTKEEVAMLMEDFDTTLATLNQKTNNCTCSNSAYIYIFVTIIFTTSLILLRKKH